MGGRRRDARAHGHFFGGEKGVTEMADTQTHEKSEPAFPWNDAIDMSSDDDGSRAVVICLSAVFDAIQALRSDLRDLTVTLDGPSSLSPSRKAVRTSRG